MPAGARRRVADGVERAAVRFVGAVREVQAEHVDAAIDQRGEDVRNGARRAERGDDFRVPHQCHGSTSAFGMRIASASASASFNWCRP